MTDREMLELAAKAAGWPQAEYQDMQGWGEVRYGFSHALYVPEIEAYWNPLADDGDALRLAVVVGIEIGNYYQYGRALAVLPTGREYWEINPDEPCSATRRAIVRAAAEIGKAMQETTS